MSLKCFFSRVFCLFVLNLLLFSSSCPESLAAYTQNEIDIANLKLRKRKNYFVSVDDELGCWPKNVIPYTILPGFTQNQVQHIINHIYQIQNRTCLRWVEKGYHSMVKKHVVFSRGKDPLDCLTKESGSEDYGDYGQEGATVRIILGDKCFPNESVIHEMMHALGFTHEHSRIDRDCYVLVNEEYALDGDFLIVEDDPFERWPYDKRSILHYSRKPEESSLLDTFYILKDKKEPYEGLIWKHRLGDTHGWWGKGNRTGRLTCLDVYKLNYRFCGAPDFCDLHYKTCQDIEEEERKTGCKQLYLDVASGKVKPNLPQN